MSTTYIELTRPLLSRTLPQPAVKKPAGQKKGVDDILEPLGPLVFDFLSGNDLVSAERVSLQFRAAAQSINDSEENLERKWELLTMNPHMLKFLNGKITGDRKKDIISLQDNLVSHLRAVLPKETSRAKLREIGQFIRDQNIPKLDQDILRAHKLLEAISLAPLPNKHHLTKTTEREKNIIAIQTDLVQENIRRERHLQARQREDSARIALETARRIATDFENNQDLASAHQTLIDICLAFNEVRGLHVEALKLIAVYDSPITQNSALAIRNVSDQILEISNGVNQLIQHLDLEQLLEQL